MASICFARELVDLALFPPVKHPSVPSVLAFMGYARSPACELRSEGREAEEFCGGGISAWQPQALTNCGAAKWVLFGEVFLQIQNLRSSACWIRQECLLLTPVKSRICCSKKGDVMEGCGEDQGCRWYSCLKSPEGRAGWSLVPGWDTVHRIAVTVRVSFLQILTSCLLCYCGQVEHPVLILQGKERGGIGEFVEETPST